MKTTLTLFLAAATVASTGCKKKEAAAPPATGSGSDTTAGSGADTTAGSAAGSGADTAGAGSAAAAATIKVTDGLQTPESVLYDEADDVYLVSNINGAPAAADDNGYISRISPEGKVLDEKWIDGAKPDVHLDAPKGSAITDGVLWVADITNVRQFDAKTGAPKGSIKIDGAMFLNDVAADGHGGIYVSDTGVDATFTPKGADAIYHITKDGKVSPLIKAKDLGGPNGITPGPDGSLWVVTFLSGEVYQVTAKGEKQPGEKLPKGQLDGVVQLDSGDLLISSWEGQAVYRGKPGGAWTEVISGVQSPADIGWDAQRKRVLIPVFQGNAVEIHPLE